MMKTLLAVTLLCLTATSAGAQNALVFQSDFGTKDGAVASMKGVALGVSSSLTLLDLTHEIPAYNIWEASIRLAQTAEYWPEGTVFVSVVDPGVGTERKSVVLKTKSGHYFVTPDNGTLTSVAAQLGIDQVREIDEAVNRRRNSQQSYTFHGRDVYAYTGARLASGAISFEQVGKLLPAEVVAIPFQEARFEDGVLHGNVPILDIQYGNVWTNIGRQTFEQLNLQPGDRLEVKIKHGTEIVLQTSLPYFQTFGGAEIGTPLIYLNSLSNVSLAVNQGNFSERFNIGSGAQWSITLSRE